MAVLTPAEGGRQPSLFDYLALADGLHEVRLTNVSHEVAISPASVQCGTDGWLEETLTNLRYPGYGVVGGVRELSLLDDTRGVMYAVQESIRADRPILPSHPAAEAPDIIR